MKLVHGSLFSGFDAPSVAAYWMGWENAFHCEINDFCNTILKYWFPNSKHYEDITKTDFSQWRGQIDILTGGFPCQPFSVAGQRKGADDNRYLWPHMLRAVREIRPTWVIGENVAGILTMVQPGEEVEVGSQATLFGEDNRKRVLLQQEYVVETICKDLERERYSVQPMLIPACAVGAPHRRDRVWFVARRAAANASSNGRQAETERESVQAKKDHEQSKSIFNTGVAAHRTDTGVEAVHADGKTEFMPLDLLPTPTARSYKNGSKLEDGRTKRKQEQGWTMELNDLATCGMLPTPTTRDYKSSMSPNGMMRKNGKLRNDALSNIPVMLGEHCTQRPGTTSQLNPLFVEEMMGFPLMWTTLPFLSQSGDKNQSRDMETP